jgi:hypothetical protein
VDRARLVLYGAWDAAPATAPAASRAHTHARARALCSTRAHGVAVQVQLRVLLRRHLLQHERQPRRVVVECSPVCSAVTTGSSVVGGATSTRTDRAPPLRASRAKPRHAPTSLLLLLLLLLLLHPPQHTCAARKLMLPRRRAHCHLLHGLHMMQQGASAACQATRWWVARAATRSERTHANCGQRARPHVVWGAQGHDQSLLHRKTPPPPRQPWLEARLDRGKVC